MQKEILAHIKKVAISIGLFSFIINLLLLVAPIYMLQLYDRILSSGSTSTLIVLTIIAVFLLSILGALEGIRSRILVHLGKEVDAVIKEDAFRSSMEQAIAGQPNGQTVRDLETMRQFIGSNAPLIFFDAPWAPLFMLVVTAIHPILGAITLVGAIIIFILAMSTDLLSKKLMAEAAGLSGQSQNFLSSSLRNIDVLSTMNLSAGIQKQWREKRDPAIELQAAASERIGTLLGITKAFRMSLQVFMLGTGGYLALQQEISAGAIVAASILGARAFAPVEQAIGAWRNIVSAKAAYKRLKESLSKLSHDPVMPLPKPNGDLTVEGLVAAIPGTQTAILKGISFKIKSGTLLGVIGPSGAGKSYMAKHIVGARKPFRGAARLGNIEISGWDDVGRGDAIGYLPQTVELFPGTIAQNIARFSDAPPEAIVEAAKLAHCHELILELTDGYDTKIGSGATMLSGGQSQRIALARAVFGAPSLVVLDEPNSNLDTNGEQQLVRCLIDLKKKGVTVVIVSHNVQLLNVVDKMLALKEGTVGAFDDKDKVMAQFSRKQPPPKAAMPAKAATKEVGHDK